MWPRCARPQAVLHIVVPMCQKCFGELSLESLVLWAVWGLLGGDGTVGGGVGRRWEVLGMGWFGVLGQSSVVGWRREALRTVGKKPEVGRCVPVYSGVIAVGRRKEDRL